MAKFIRRFEAMERRVSAQGRRLEDCGLAELDAHWDAVKAAERLSPSGGAGASRSLPPRETRACLTTGAGRFQRETRFFPEVLAR